MEFLVFDDSGEMNNNKYFLLSTIFITQAQLVQKWN